MKSNKRRLIVLRSPEWAAVYWENDTPSLQQRDQPWHRSFRPCRSRHEAVRPHSVARKMTRAREVRFRIRRAQLHLASPRAMRTWARVRQRVRLSLCWRGHHLVPMHQWHLDPRCVEFRLLTRMPRTGFGSWKPDQWDWSSICSLWLAFWFANDSWSCSQMP